MRSSVAALALVALAALMAAPVQAQLPDGYLVWSKGDLGDMASRKIYRMNLPAKDGLRVLTSGEDVECQVSPDGRWVAYAKAKLPGGTDYHSFSRWSLYLVSIEGIDHGGEELLIDTDGYWPSWGADGTLYYSQANGQHTLIMRVELDAQGGVLEQSLLLDTEAAFPSIPEINECFVAPDASWFAGRTRGISASGVGAYAIDPPRFERMAWAGSAGCMPYVAADGAWGFNAGSNEGVLWGDAPWGSDRSVDQQLIPAISGGRCYHPGTSTDGRWALTGHSSTDDQNAGPWNLYIYRLQGQSVSDEQLLAAGGFNGWPHVWVRPGAVDAGAPDVTPAQDRAAPDLGAADILARDALTQDVLARDVLVPDGFARDALAPDGSSPDARAGDAADVEVGLDAGRDAAIIDVAGAEQARPPVTSGDAQRAEVGAGCACSAADDAALAWWWWPSVLLPIILRRRMRSHEHQS